MMKGKKYDWKDSNLALFGSDIEKQVKSKYTMPGGGGVLSQKKYGGVRLRIKSRTQI